MSSACTTGVLARNRFGRSMPVRITSGSRRPQRAARCRRATRGVAVAVRAMVGGSPSRSRYRAEARVVGAEVVAPLADAVRLVDRQARDAAGAAPRARKSGLRKRSGVDVEQLQLAAHRRVEPRAPLAGVDRGVDEGGADAARAQRVDLVLHQRDQRADDQREAVEQQRRELVDERLARARSASSAARRARPARPRSPRPGARGRPRGRSAPSGRGGRPASSARAAEASPAILASGAGPVHTYARHATDGPPSPAPPALCAPAAAALLRRCGRAAPRRPQRDPGDARHDARRRARLLRRPAGLTPHLDGWRTRACASSTARTVAPADPARRTPRSSPACTRRATACATTGSRRCRTRRATLAERGARWRGSRPRPSSRPPCSTAPSGSTRASTTTTSPRRAEQQTSELPLRRAPAGETAQAARWWLGGRDRARAFFLWLHFYDPHVPYAPPRLFLRRARRRSVPGRDRARRPRRSASCSAGCAPTARSARDRSSSLTADHGESLGEHGEPTHGALCYDATLHVPLIVRFLRRARRRGHRGDRRPCADVFPTLVDALGLAPGAAGDADGLDGSTCSARVPDDRGVYFESYSGFLNYGWSPLAGWTDRAGKYLHSSRPELYAGARTRARRRT